MTALAMQQAAAAASGHQGFVYPPGVPFMFFPQPAVRPGATPAAPAAAAKDKAPEAAKDESV